MNSKLVQYVFDYKDESGISRTAYVRDKICADEIEEELKTKGLTYIKKKLLYWSCKVV